MIRTMSSRASALSAVVLLALPGPTVLGLGPAGEDTASPPPAGVYDEKADAGADVAAALARAGQQHKRVLLVFGANWCPWCLKLHNLFESNRQIARLLLYEYETVLVDIGRMNKHLDLARRYGADLRKAGVPFLTVLDAAGKTLVNQETGSLEAGDHHDPDKVKAFLTRWKTEPPDAKTAYSHALARAAREDKRVLVSFSAPWCTWCRRFEAFMVRRDIAVVMDRAYVWLNVDTERMPRAKELDQSIRGKGGYPWFAVQDASGKTLMTSEGAQGNVGYPVEPHEIAHFVEVIRRTAVRAEATEISTIEQALQDVAAQIKAARAVPDR